MGAVVFAGFMGLGALIMGVLGYATGYHDGLNKRDDLIEEEEIEKENYRGNSSDRSTKRIDFDLRSDG